MDSTSTIPKIAVTHDDQSIDDSNYFTLTEALTDIEDLDDDEYSRPKTEIKSKLRIKLIHDDALTDLEDFEASDEEYDKSVKAIIPHSEPINLDDLDLEGGIFEESYKTQVKTQKGKRKLKTQSSTSQIKSKEIDYKIFENYTDEEIFDTDNEVIKDIIRETDIDLDSYNVESVNISDNANKISRSPSPLPNFKSDSFLNNQQFLSALSLSPNISDLTDVEVLLSDSDSEKSFKKAKPKRRRHRGNRRASVTDVEDLDVSDDDSRFASYVKPKRKSQSKITIKQHVSPYDSDNEDNFRIPFPICKKIAQKKQNILNIPEFDTNFPTDIEDFGDISENIPIPEDSKEEDAALEEKLDEMASYYSDVKEAHSSVKNKKVCRAQSFKSDDTINDADTDSDICQTETSDKEKKDEEEDSVIYDIKFETTPTVETKIKSKSNLLLQVVKDEDPVTDCENVDSSDEEVFKTIPIALAEHIAAVTDEEDFGDDTDDSNNTPEIELPPPVRNLIILKDNEAFPTIQILPLTDESPIQSPEESMNVETDEESVSEGEEAVEGIMPISISDFNLLDCGIINESEHVQKQSKKLQVPIKDDENDLTDTEELVMSTRRRRPPKFKHMHERFMAEKNKLSVKNEPAKDLTDTEDVVLSDGNSDEFHSLSPLINLPCVAQEALTDVEVIGNSTDDEKHFRELSCTPDHMRQLSGNMVMNKEGSGPFSLQERLLVNKPLKMVGNMAITPSHTDTEDLVASADEDASYSRAETATPNQIHIDLDQSSKIVSESKRKLGPEGCMYLKGGGYIHQLTDVEYISEEEGHFNNKVQPVLVGITSECDFKISLNFRDGSACFKGEREWEASRKPQGLRLEPTAPALEKEAAQKGADHPVSSSSVREGTASSSTRTEGEEGAEKDESGYERSVADQHQLSEEMKELLKELEKESKQ